MIILKKVFVPLMVTLLIAVMGVGSMCFAEGVAIPAGGGYSEQAAESCDGYAGLADKTQEGQSGVDVRTGIWVRASDKGWNLWPVIAVILICLLVGAVVCRLMKKLHSGELLWGILPVLGVIAAGAIWYFSIAEPVNGYVIHTLYPDSADGVRCNVEISAEISDAMSSVEWNAWVR